MAKLTTLLALLGALLVISDAASALRTTITTVEVEEEPMSSSDGGGGGSSSSCRKQIQKEAQGLSHCEKLFEDVSSSQAWDGIVSKGGGSTREARSLEYSQHFRPCCQQLRQLDTQCRCEGIRQVVREEQQGESKGQQGKGSVQEVVRSFQNLPSLCGISPQYCRIRAIWY